MLELGLHAESVQRRVVDGRLERIHPGIYRFPGYPPTWDQRIMAAVLVGGPGAAVSFEAAAMGWKLEGMTTDRPHITVVHPQQVRLPGVIVHRTRLFAPGDVVKRGALRVT